MENVNITAGTLQPSGVWSRIGSYLLDALIFVLGIGIICSVVLGSAFRDGEMLPGHGGMLAVLGSAILVAWFFYFPFMESSERQATLGKMITHLKVVDSNGGKVSLLRATGRNLVKLLCIIIGFLKLVSIIVMLCNERKRCIHDFAASTYVVRS